MGKGITTGKRRQRSVAMTLTLFSGKAEFICTPRWRVGWRASASSQGLCGGHLRTPEIIQSLFRLRNHLPGNPLGPGSAQRVPCITHTCGCISLTHPSAPGSSPSLCQQELGPEKRQREQRAGSSSHQVLLGRDGQAMGRKGGKEQKTEMRCVDSHRLGSGATGHGPAQPGTVR